MGSTGTWDLNYAKGLVSAMYPLRLDTVDPDLRGEFLAYSALVGLHIAVWKRYIRAYIALVPSHARTHARIYTPVLIL